MRLQNFTIRPIGDNSLVDVVVLPVILWGIVPFANGGRRRIHDTLFVEAGDKVSAANDVVGVEEPECAILKTRDELDPIQPLRFPPRTICVVNLKPTNPE
jgi:hypothetical protein